MKKSMSSFNLLCITALILISGCNNDEQDDQKEIMSLDYASETFVYGEADNVDPNLLSLDVYHAGEREELRPVLIYVHGGAWVVGDKSQNIDNKKRLVRDLDYILVSINYRLSPFPYELDNPARIHFPVHNRDAADAIRWVYDNIEKYGGDKSKIGLMGHSAGAQLVSLMGTNELFIERVGMELSDLKFVISVDTRGYDVGKQLVEGANPDIYENAFTTDTRFHELGSPLYNISRSKGIPPFFVAKRGGILRILDANDFINGLKAADVNVESIDGSIYDHEGINTAIGEVDEVVITQPIKEFLKSVIPD